MVRARELPACGAAEGGAQRAAKAANAEAVPAWFAKAARARVPHVKHALAINSRAVDDAFSVLYVLAYVPSASKEDDEA